jgi:hypothetical protein
MSVIVCPGKLAVLIRNDAVSAGRPVAIPVGVVNVTLN